MSELLAKERWMRNKHYKVIQSDKVNVISTQLEVIQLSLSGIRAIDREKAGEKPRRQRGKETWRERKENRVEMQSRLCK